MGKGIEVLGSVYHRNCVEKTLNAARRCDVCNGSILPGKGVEANGLRYHFVCVDALIKDCEAVSKVTKKVDEAVQGEFDGMFFP